MKISTIIKTRTKTLSVVTLNPSMARRPVSGDLPEEFYNEEVSKKYSENPVMIQIQSELAERALDLLGFKNDEPKLILEIGCGPGMSSDLLEGNGHYWIGMDISIHMLNVARTRTVTGSLLLSDMGDGIPFRPKTFDAAISISALQWLFIADNNAQSISKRLYKLFSTLHAALEQGAKAVFQFYPSDQHQIDLITTQARRAGFNGGLVIDFPESPEAITYFLYLVAGGSATVEMPCGLQVVRSEPITISNAECENTSGPRKSHPAPCDDSKAGGSANVEMPTNSSSELSTISNAGRGNTSGQRRGHRAPVKNSREWILNKKERRRRQGKDT